MRDKFTLRHEPHIPAGAQRRARDRVEWLLQQAGIALNGSQPWDMRVHNEQLYARILTQGTLDLGEAYIEGWWDCERLNQFAC